MRRIYLALTVACAGLALALSACGNSDQSAGPPTLRPPADPKDQLQFGKNVARVGGISPSDVAAAAVTAVYPPGEAAGPSAWFFVRDDEWTDAVLAAQFATGPIDGAVVGIDKDYLPTPTHDVLSRVSAKGYPKAKGLRGIVVGGAGQDVLVGIHDLRLKATVVKEKTPFALGESLVPFHGGGAGRYSPSIVVASAEDRDYALPAAAWAAYSGDALVLVHRDDLPAASRRTIAQRQKLTLERPHIYAIGPEKVISDSVLRDLGTYGKVQRIAGPSAIETAIELARFRDPDTLFGWGLRRGPASVSLVNTEDWGNALGAFTFAAAGPQAPLLLTDSSERLPEPVVDYLRSLRGDEQNEGFVFGDRDSISSDEFDELDRALVAP